MTNSQNINRNNIIPVKQIIKTDIDGMWYVISDQFEGQLDAYTVSEGQTENDMLESYTPTDAFVNLDNDSYRLWVRTV
jgi:hypothetical protein